MNNEKGITLIELLVSVVILAFVLVPLLTVMSGSLTRTVTQEHDTGNAYTAQEVMEKIRMNEGIYRVERNADGSGRYYCASQTLAACTGHVGLHDAFVSELNLRGDQIVEVFVSEYADNPAFNEVTVVVRNDDVIAYGPDGGTLETENRIELATVVKQ